MTRGTILLKNEAVMWKRGQGGGGISKLLYRLEMGLYLNFKAAIFQLYANIFQLEVRQLSVSHEPVTT